MTVAEGTRTETSRRHGGLRRYYAAEGFRHVGSRVMVEEEGRSRRLQHRVRHSPTGMSWGYGGSGPADTARSIMWDHLGFAPATELYQQFKNEHVAEWPQDEGWEITSAEIDAWLVAYKAACPTCEIREH